VQKTKHRPGKKTIYRTKQGEDGEDVAENLTGDTETEPGCESGKQLRISVALRKKRCVEGWEK
jgi:hypothetical protein